MKRYQRANQHDYESFQIKTTMGIPSTSEQTPAGSRGLRGETFAVRRFETDRFSAGSSHFFLTSHHIPRQSFFTVMEVDSIEDKVLQNIKNHPNVCIYGK
jgi:hypothetical protein